MYRRKNKSKGKITKNTNECMMYKQNNENPKCKSFIPFNTYLHYFVISVLKID